MFSTAEILIALLPIKHEQKFLLHSKLHDNFNLHPLHGHGMEHFDVLQKLSSKS